MPAITLVVGATGLLGGEICRRLRGRERPVRALVRPGSAGERKLRDLGVEVVSGDLRAPETLAAACRGAEAVISTATAMGSRDKSLKLRAVDRDGQLALVKAAQAAGVARFVYVSLSPHLRPAAPLVRYKREIEQAIRASGMHWTLLQPSVFMDVWLSPALGWDFAAARATVFGPGVSPISYIASHDIAEYAVRSLEDPRLDNRDLPLGGPEALPPNEVVRIFEEVSGRAYKVKRVPKPMLSILAPVAALVNEEAGSGMSLCAQAASGDVIDSPLQRELGLPLTTVREYAASAVGAAARSGS